jgi:hypothetical protein
MRTKPAISEPDVFQQLERLERAVYVPIVSGEAARWLASVTKAAQQVEKTVCEYYQSVHPQLYQQIADHDPEQMPRVQGLEQEDEEICKVLRDVVAFARKLHGASEQIEPDEHLISTATKELSDRLVGIILRIRKHETEVSTWHVEAMLRDRGAAD